MRRIRSRRVAGVFGFDAVKPIMSTVHRKEEPALPRFERHAVTRNMPRFSLLSKPESFHLRARWHGCLAPLQRSTQARVRLPDLCTNRTVRPVVIMIGADRKGPTDGQSDAIDPVRTSRRMCRFRLVALAQILHTLCAIGQYVPIVLNRDDGQ